MTAEHVSLLESTDLRALRLICCRCRSAVTMHLNETLRIPDGCPVCGEVWRASRHQGITAVEALGTALKAWIQTERDQKAPFVLRFEIETPHA